MYLSTEISSLYQNLVPTFCDRHNILLVRDIIINDIFDQNFAISYLLFLFVCFFN